MYLGIDLGTSSVKTLLIDSAQALIASASATVELSRPHPGWSEQDPADWIAATETALDELKAKHGAELAAVKGIGLSGHMHGATLLDAADKVLRPRVERHEKLRRGGEARRRSAFPQDHRQHRVRYRAETAG